MLNIKIKDILKFTTKKNCIHVIFLERKILYGHLKY